MNEMSKGTFGSSVFRFYSLFASIRYISASFFSFISFSGMSILYHCWGSWSFSQWRFNSSTPYFFFQLDRLRFFDIDFFFLLLSNHWASVFVWQLIITYFSKIYTHDDLDLSIWIWGWCLESLARMVPTFLVFQGISVCFRKSPFAP